MRSSRFVAEVNFNVDNIVISKLVETRTNSKHLAGYLDNVKRSFVLVLPKTSGYLKLKIKVKKIN